MNVVAGILIGIFAGSWTLRLLIPFLWGVVFVVYQWILNPHVLGGHRAKAGEARWGLSPAASFLLVEYATAATTALVAAAVSGLLASLF